VATNWHKHGHRCNKQIDQLIWAICDPIQLVFQAAFSEITIYGNSLLFLWMDLLQTWSEDAQTVYLSKLQLGSTNLKVCGRRNSRISESWWAISAIRRLLLLLLLNCWANSFAFQYLMDLPKIWLKYTYIDTKQLHQFGFEHILCSSSGITNRVFWNYHIRQFPPLTVDVSGPNLARGWTDIISF